MNDIAYRQRAHIERSRTLDRLEELGTCCRRMEWLLAEIAKDSTVFERAFADAPEGFRQLPAKLRANLEAVFDRLQHEWHVQDKALARAIPEHIDREVMAAARAIREESAAMDEASAKLAARVARMEGAR